MSIQSTQELIDAILRAGKGSWSDRVEYLILDGTIDVDGADSYREWGKEMDRMTAGLAEARKLLNP